MFGKDDLYKRIDDARDELVELKKAIADDNLTEVSNLQLSLRTLYNRIEDYRNNQEIQKELKNVR